MIFACTKESALNAWFDKNLNARKCFDVVNLALAIDSPDGLLVPVIHDAARYDSAELRQIINQYKQEAATRTLTVDKFKEPSITLSNFGKFAGRFASPIIVPPMVAILAVGRLYEGVVSYNGQICAHKLLPLSLSFDHRAVTGGEATRFLAALIQSLQAP